MIKSDTYMYGKDSSTTTELRIVFDALAARLDHFCLTVTALPLVDKPTKRALVSDIAKAFDVLPYDYQSEILQRLWEEKIGKCDKNAWLDWRTELGLVTLCQAIPQCNYPNESYIIDRDTHEFCSSLEEAYMAAVYFRFTDSKAKIYLSFLIAKTRVAQSRG